MKGDPLPPVDHVARYCKFESLDEVGNPTGDAFRLRVGKEDSVSVNWLEHLDRNDRHEALSQLRAVLAAKLRVGTKARLAVLNALNTIEHVKKGAADERILQILHEPLNDPIDDPSHAGIFGTEPEGGLIGDLIAETVVDVVEAKRAGAPKTK